MSLKLSDIVVGEVYEFCDPIHPDWVGHTFRCTEIRDLVFGTTIVPPKGWASKYPEGVIVSHFAHQIRLYHASQAALLFS